MSEILPPDNSRSESHAASLTPGGGGLSGCTCDCSVEGQRGWGRERDGGTKGECGCFGNFMLCLSVIYSTQKAHYTFILYIKATQTNLTDVTTE